MGIPNEESLANLQRLTQIEHQKTLAYRPPAARQICDFEVCVGVDELKQTLRAINASRLAVISVTQYEEEYTVFFRRTVYENP